MLRLNNCTRIENINHTNHELNVAMYASFDKVTKAGKVKHKNAENFTINSDSITLNGEKFELKESIDIHAEADEILDYLKKRYATNQPDMFLRAPNSKPEVGRRLYQSLKWEYPNLAWRAMDKSGAVAYFKHRPVLDKAGFWISNSLNVYPKYGHHLCIIQEDFKFSLQNINTQNINTQGDSHDTP